MERVAGIDAGATRTRVVILTARGGECGRAEGPGALAGHRGAEAAAETVAKVVREALERVGAHGPLEAIWAGLAGAGREPVRSRVEQALEGTGVARRVRVGTDTEAAFHAAFPAGPGILVVAGTGSMGLARGEDGQVRRCGGWGAEMGDEGSAFALGAAALRGIVRSHDGRSPATGLTDRVLRLLALDRVEDLVEWRGSASKADVAALAPAVVAAAAAGDSTARTLVDRAAEELTLLVETLTGRLGPWATSPRVAASGGLVDPGAVLRAPLEAALRARGIRLDPRRVDACAGAGELARNMLDGGPR